MAQSDCGLPDVEAPPATPVPNLETAVVDDTTLATAATPTVALVTANVVVEAISVSVVLFN